MLSLSCMASNLPFIINSIAPSADAITSMLCVAAIYMLCNYVGCPGFPCHRIQKKSWLLCIHARCACILLGLVNRGYCCHLCCQQDLPGNHSACSTVLKKLWICCRSVALGQRAPNRATAREEGRGLGAGMKGSGMATARPRSPAPGCVMRRLYCTFLAVVKQDLKPILTVEGS